LRRKVQKYSFKLKKIMRTGGNPIYVKNGVYLYKKHEIKKG